MSYIHIKKTKSGNYHYRVESYWDKKLQQPRQCSVYIGKEDPATGEVKPIHDRLRTTTPDRVLDYGRRRLSLSGRAPGASAGLAECL